MPKERAYTQVGQLQAELRSGLPDSIERERRVYTLGQLIERYIPVQKGQRAPSFFIEPPTGLELKAMGMMMAGEIGITLASNRDGDQAVDVSGKLKVTYGMEGSVHAKRCLIHNHPEASTLPSQADAKTSAFEGLTVEFTENDEGIARIRYHFRKRKDTIIIEKFFSKEKREEEAPETDEPFRERVYLEPTRISGLPIDDGDKLGNVEGVYDMTFVPWEFFLERYQKEIFFNLFRRNKNWATFFSSRPGYTFSQTPQPHPSPQPQT